MKLFLNGKQNGSYSSLLEFTNNLKEGGAHEVIIFPPFPYLSFINYNKIKVGAQNVSEFENGAFTGEVGAKMLKEVNVKYCLIGHSERRLYFKEDNNILSKKITHLLNHSIIPVLCVGESLKERKCGTMFKVLEEQMKVFQEKVIVAYEPIWAIGTGSIPTIKEISEVAIFFKQNYNISILYGGSVNESNIKEISSISNIEGVLVGGASLEFKKVNKMLELCLL